jgi:general stress protein 26
MDQIELAKEFAKILKARGSGLHELLTDDAQFVALNVDIRGREAVMERLLGEDTGRNYREATWIDSKPHGDFVRITAKMPDAAAHAGHILLLEFRNSRLYSIKQQNLYPARQGQIEPLRLTEELIRLVNNASSARHPMLLAHVDENGQPVLSFRGSTQAFSECQLAIWVRSSTGGLIRSIKKNPKVALMYRDEEKKATFQFQGRARITTGEKERRQIYQTANKVEQDHDFVEAGVALIIDLDRVEGYAGLTPAGPVGRINMSK